MGKINVNQSFDPLYSDSDNKIKADGREIISISNNDMDKILGSNLLFPRRSIEWYTKFNRYGCIDPFNSLSENREFLFFTKPDLNIFATETSSDNGLISGLTSQPLFVDAYQRYRKILCQLESSVTSDGNTSPFMCLLSNAVTSRLDLPGISAEDADSTQNIYGTSIKYRGHSLKSDNGFNFTLSFTDTVFLEIYELVKLYDEYARLCKLGYVETKKKYIENKILPDQFSIYKFIVGADGETILYAAKIIGVFFTDVPRSDFGDPGQDGFKYSLSFYGQFVEDNTLTIINDFNKVSGVTSTDYKPVYDNNLNIVNNEWVSSPVITTSESATRANLGLGTYDFKLKWV